MSLSKGRFIADVLITDVKLPGGIDGWLIAERCGDLNRAGLSSGVLPVNGGSGSKGEIG
ncbi:hypothetical protein IVB14_31215 [Bradyrhizobium sp. 180]|uniref:hypothetical protein n=1 Tax=unclassified Bradyrhizobium TaxID=2631580 RepID=UPI001FFC1157|nr:MULTISPECIES: hypothetical protein [unclassified Bradyrhizobium]MCK1494763.1 hypothetical protein [Bradyrhizobium sp. 180]MCK1526888.1 hypothetical protein [Bradyrhizobium sp. 182]MCK1598370.1 hypothetical protein [Bradyrhizobium sp. 164]MCK1620771.1 hypothetical protein [Bradyrhizobium sp. 159]MCK1666927.1 hypothetical protein [Bradyrhizobium sp. 153]